MIASQFKRRMLLCVLAAVLVWIPVRAGAVSPGQFVENFYVWYLSGLGSPSRDFMKPHTPLDRYVTTALLRKLRYAEAHSGPTGPDADYFMQAQNLDEAFQTRHVPGWRARITATALRSWNNTATVNVFFKGVHFDHALQVHIVRVSGEWRIDSVNALGR